MSGQHSNGRSGSATTTISPLTDIRTLGPILLVVFGLVLIFTPMTTAGERNSVGNAGGGQTVGCPTQEQVDNMLATWQRYEDNPSGFLAPPRNPEQIQNLVDNCTCDHPFGGGGAGIVAPSCDASPSPSSSTTTPTTTPTTAAPTTAAPTTSAAPTTPPPEPTAPPPASETTAPPQTTAPPPATTEPPPVVTTAPPAPDGEDDGTEALPPPPATSGQLPATGSGGPTLATAAGAMLVALGGLLLVSTRRRPLTSAAGDKA